MTNKLGEFILKMREGKEISTHTLAKNAGLSQAYLSKIENGKIPSPEKLKGIAEALDVDYNLLMFKAGHLPSYVGTAQVTAEPSEIEEANFTKPYGNDLELILLNEPLVLRGRRLSESQKKQIRYLLYGAFPEHFEFDWFEAASPEFVHNKQTESLKDIEIQELKSLIEKFEKEVSYKKDSQNDQK